MTREEAQQAWEKMRSEIDETNWLFVGTINPQMVDIAIEALQADTVAVVRCKDCKHAYKRKPINKTAVLCELFGAGMKDNDFCSCGERSDNANTD